MSWDNNYPSLKSSFFDQMGQEDYEKQQWQNRSTPASCYSSPSAPLSFKKAAIMRQLQEQLKIYWNTKRYKEIICLLESTISFFSGIQLFASYTYLGGANQKLRNYEEAIYWFKRIITEGNNSHFINFRIAVTYFLMEEYSKALPYLQKALIINDDQLSNLYKKQEPDWKETEWKAQIYVFIAATYMYDRFAERNFNQIKSFIEKAYSAAIETKAKKRINQLTNTFLKKIEENDHKLYEKLKAIILEIKK